jgi:hypothetical protein
MKGSTTTQETQATNNYTVKVTRAKEVKEGTVVFDMIVNGISIYGCWYREGEKDGKEYKLVSFPSQKGNDGKYYNHAWFKIEDDVKNDIIEQLQKLV